MHILSFIFLITFLIPAFTKDSNAATPCSSQQERVGSADVWRECDKNTGVVTKEEWRVDGELSREDGPARVNATRDETGITVMQEWHLNGMAHPNPGPSLIHYDAATNAADREEWHKNGKPHREGGLPAVIHYDPATGNVKSQEYWRNGKKQ